MLRPMRCASSQRDLYINHDSGIGAAQRIQLQTTGIMCLYDKVELIEQPCFVRPVITVQDVEEKRNHYNGKRVEHPLMFDMPHDAPQRLRIAIGDCGISSTAPYAPLIFDQSVTSVIYPASDCPLTRTD